jgi:hypothetical protein
MASSWMLRSVVLVRTDVSEELSASFIKVAMIGELGMVAVVSNQRTLLYSHRRENLKSYSVFPFIMDVYILRKPESEANATVNVLLFPM